MRLDILNLGLMLCAAGAVLAGGTILARREVQERVPVDRTLIREFALEFSGELRRLESVYLDDLQQLAGKASTENQTSLKESCSSLRGVRQYSLLYKKSERQAKHIKTGPLTGELIPEPVVRSAKEPSLFPHQITLAREQLFPKSSSEAEKDEGWVMPRDDKFAVFWKRSGEDTVQAFLLDLREIGKIASDYLKPKIMILYTPVRAEGGLHRLEGPGGAFLAGLEKPPQRAPDFIVPFSSRIGNWQILSWDTFQPNVVYHQPTLFVTGTLTVVLVAAGLILFIQQRRAQRLAEQRVSFVNRVSHELGTPLTNILLNLELSVEALNAGRQQDTRRRLDFVVEEATRLARLVRNVLVFSRRERGKLKVNPAPCVPDEVIASVLNQFGPALARSGIEIENHGAASETILCDIDSLAQIVANLVSNVEKYAASGKWLDIGSSLVDNMLVVRVSDRGPGIPVAAREIIFHPFERVDNSVHEGITGTGLGLAIARDLAELMGGTLKLVAADKGAVFELRLPAQAAPKEKEV
jgi:signal transduction histidine kinase